MRKHYKVFIILIMIIAITGGLFTYKLYRENINATRVIKGIVEFDGYSTEVLCTGKGSPTVVFEPGLNESYGTFLQIQEELAKVTRTFSYDRMSIAFKDAGKKQRTSLEQVQNLHKLLKAQKIKAPYLLVAHSIAGYNVRLFAANYPEEVAGVIFIDCSHEDQTFGSITDDPNCSELTCEELDISAKQVKEARKKDALRHIPITVLTAGYKNRETAPGQLGFWIPKQQDIASLSDDSRHITVEDSGHIVQGDQPEVVIREIKAMLKRIEAIGEH